MPFIRSLVCTGKLFLTAQGRLWGRAAVIRGHHACTGHIISTSPRSVNKQITQRCKKETQVQGRTPHIFSKNKWTQKYNVPVKKKKKNRHISTSFFFLFVNTRYAELSSQAFFTSGFAGTLAIQPWFTTGCSDQQMRRWKDRSNPGPHDPHVC